MSEPNLYSSPTANLVKFSITLETYGAIADSYD